jgi:hypothetical protein
MSQTIQYAFFPNFSPWHFDGCQQPDLLVHYEAGWFHDFRFLVEKETSTARSIQQECFTTGLRYIWSVCMAPTPWPTTPRINDRSRWSPTDVRCNTEEKAGFDDSKYWALQHRIAK